ncbi:MAG: BolA family protein [Pseudomonadota bacterium]
MDDVRAELERRLTEALQPERLVIADESERHRGHQGYKPGGNTHFRVEVRASSLAGLTRVAQQRRVYEAVGDLMNAPIHALAIDARPGD